MRSIGGRIKLRRKQLKMSADILGDKLGKNRATIYRYESDDIENMPMSILSPLAAALGVTPSWLMGWDTTEAPEGAFEYPYFPGSISAGLPISVETIKDDDLQYISLPDSFMGKWAGRDGVYVTRVNGDSMNKIIPHNSLIAVHFVDPYDLKNGDIVVYSINGEYSVKSFYNDVENKRLIFRPQSTVGSFTDNIISYDCADDLKLHGRVIVYVVEL